MDNVMTLLWNDPEFQTMLKVGLRSCKDIQEELIQQGKVMRIIFLFTRLKYKY